jgi:hypothetical protein
MPSIADVADWMAREVERKEWLPQEDALRGIERYFGCGFIHVNGAGHEAINDDVLAELRKHTATTIVWDRSERAWRLRDTADGPNR